MLYEVCERTDGDEHITLETRVGKDSRAFLMSNLWFSYGICKVLLMAY